MSGLFALLGDHTIQNVLGGATLLGIICGVLGSFAVIRQQSLLGDTLSHAALPGVCLGFLIAGGRSLPSILAGALFTAILAALVMLALTRMSRLKTDAGLGIALSVFFAVGVVLSIWLASPRIAIASGTAFLTAQMLDVAVFDRLRSGSWWRAPLVSSLIGSAAEKASVKKSAVSTA
ncbi:MAG: metal ABC transporter permease, partial [Pseudomonadota bacterium]